MSHVVVEDVEDFTEVSQVVVLEVEDLTEVSQKVVELVLE